MSTETYRLTFCEQEELIQGKGVCFTSYNNLHLNLLFGLSHEDA